MVVKGRSPNYPSIDLRDALEVVASLYKEVGRGIFSPMDAARGWKYASELGPTKQRLAALRQYGLLERRKGAKLRFSQIAMTLLIRQDASTEYQEALKGAAFSPPIFKKLQESMRGAAPDALRQSLIIDLNFTDSGADKVIEVYRKTIDLLEETKEDSIEADIEGRKSESVAVTPGSAARPVSQMYTDEDQDSEDVLFESVGMRSVQIPLQGIPWVILRGPFPISEKNWKQMMQMIEAMKPGLVDPQMDMQAESRQNVLGPIKGNQDGVAPRDFRPIPNK